MRQTDIEAERRRALIEATIAEVGSAGSLDVTVARIARRAGVSPALAHHYFGSKDRLFLAAMRAILSSFAEAARRRLSRAATARARLEALVEASFDGLQTRPHVVTAWLVFYVQALSAPEAARLLRIYRRRLDANFRHALRSVAPGREAAIAASLGAAIDGLYIRLAPEKDGLSPDAARDAALHALDAALAVVRPVAPPADTDSNQ